MKNKRGSQIAEWGVAFAVVVAVGATAVTPLKRALHSKAAVTADYVFWNQKLWGGDGKPTQQPPEATTRSKFTADQIVDNRLNEKHGGAITSFAENTQTQASVSVGVAEGEEGRLTKDGPGADTVNKLFTL